MFLRLFIFCFLVYGESVSAQSCLEVSQSSELYSNSNDIINGIKWINEKKYSGSPMLAENYWPKADILYNGVHFKDIRMNYDVYKEDLIVFYPEKGQEKYVMISKDSLSSFTFTDTLTNRNHFYEFIELAGVKGKALYENVSVGKASLFIQPLKIFQTTPGEIFQGKYSTYYKYFIKAGNEYINFNSKKQFINLLAHHNIELKRFIRKEKLKINNKLPENIIVVLKYFDGLN